MRGAGADDRTNDGRDLGMGQELRDPGFELSVGGRNRTWSFSHDG